MKNSWKNALYSAFGFILPVTVALFTTPYILHQLTPEVYGIYVLAISLMGLMSFLDLGFGQGIIKFVSRYEASRDYEKINRIIGVSLIIHVAMGSLGCILILTFSGFLAQGVFRVSPRYISTASLAFNIAAFGFLVSFINGVFSNISRALQRYDMAVKIQNVIWLASVLTAVLLLYGGKGLVDILIANTCWQTLGLIIFYRAAKKILPSFKMKPGFDKTIFREIFSFSAFSSINSIAGSIVFIVDKMIIGAFLGTAAVAYYQVPFMMVQMTNGFINSVSQFLFPAISFVDSLGDKERLKQIFAKSIRYAAVLALIMTGALILLGSSFLSLWMGKEFAEKSALVIPIISVVFFFICVATIGFHFFNGLGEAKINMISSLAAASCYLVAAFILVPRWGLRGAALAFAFILVPLPLYFYILNRLIQGNIRWLIDTAIKSIFILALALGLRYIIPMPMEIGWFILTGLLIVAGAVLMSYLLKIIYLQDFLEIISKLKFRGTAV